MKNDSASPIGCGAMIFTIAAKELKSLFSGPMAWIILAVLEIVLAYFFLNQVDAFLTIQPQLTALANPPGVTELIVTPLFGNAAIILLMAVPLLSMRLIAEEKRNQTLNLLLSAPISVSEIILGKFLGLMAFLSLFIGLAALMYAQDHDNTLPDADDWTAQLKEYAKNEQILRCPGAPTPVITTI